VSRHQLPALGVLLNEPPLSRWGTWLQRNPHRQPEACLELARRYSIEQGFQFQEGRSGRIIMSGHQPGFIHPGVWVKMFVLEAAAEALDATCIHLQVDSDLPSVLAPPLPPDHHPVTWFTPPGGHPFEVLEAPNRQAWERFLAQVGPYPGLRAAGEATWANVGPQPTLGRFLDVLRRTYEAPRRYLELPISALCTTAGFIGFVADVLKRLEDFHAAYNGELAAYRTRHRVRSPANPIPDLRHRPDAVESPFWVVDAQGFRRGLWVQPDGTLLAREVPVGRFDGTPASLSGLRLRPRALTLTLYCRRYLCDLFIHGVGGARYDAITDGIFRRFWGLEAPPFACISLSLSPLDPPRPEDPRVPRLALRELQHNPQRVAPEDSLAPEKLDLIARMAATPSRQQGPLAARIRQVNETMASRLSDVRETLAARQVEDEEEATRFAAATARDYPYFCFQPETLTALVRPLFDQSLKGARAAP
jgi:hypothetical protein